MGTRYPTVSIGLPVYNGEQFLTEAIESVLDQTFEDFELVISDNASTDRTAEICRIYVARDPRIRFFCNARNMGAAFNYARVLQLSTGKYFKWLADDDLCEPTFLARCVETLESRPDAVLAYTKTYWIDEGGCLFEDGVEVVRNTSWPSDPAERFLQLVNEFTRNGGHTAAIYIFGLLRREVAREMQLQIGYKGGDLGFLAELSLYGTFVEVPEYLLSLRAGPGSASWRWMSHPEEAIDFWNPMAKGLASSAIFRCRRYWEYLRAVARSPVNSRKKVDLLVYCLSLGPQRIIQRLKPALPN